MKKIYITTAIDYTNDVIHLGHAYQKILSDALARYYRQTLGKDNVYFLTGTDEYGTTSEKAAAKAGKKPEEFVAEIAEANKQQYKKLNISYDRFIRTTDEDHHKTVYEFWKQVEKTGDIYKGTYEGLYCEGCESYKTMSELVDGKCPLHPTREIQRVQEENYFFKWSKYTDFLKQYISAHDEFIIPTYKRNELLAFLNEGLDDIPISRPKYKVSWGIPVPGDEEQRIYVWFDALINYYTAAKNIGFWDDQTNIIHILGKDNLHKHALLWPAMLKSASLRLPSSIYSHGFINLNGQKISKSLGNIIRPDELVNQFGSDPIRYFLLKYGPATEDVDISLEKIRNVYNSELANDWGNLVSRIAKLCEKVILGSDSDSRIQADPGQARMTFTPQVGELFESFKVYDAITHINNRITDINQYINREEPWLKEGEELKKILRLTVGQIRQIAFDLQPIMPESSVEILKQFSSEKIASNKPYFERRK